MLLLSVGGIEYTIDPWNQDPELFGSTKVCIGSCNVESNGVWCPGKTQIYLEQEFFTKGQLRSLNAVKPNSDIVNRIKCENMEKFETVAESDEAYGELCKANRTLKNVSLYNTLKLLRWL